MKKWRLRIVFQFLTLPFYVFFTRSKCITRTIEWRFHSTDVVLLDHGWALLPILIFRRASIIVFLLYQILMFHWLIQCYYRINENSTFSSVIEKHLKPGPWNHKLKPFCAEQLDCLKFFIRKYPKVFPFPCWLIVVDLLIIDTCGTDFKP